jgi:hypothetical protein
VPQCRIIIVNDDTGTINVIDETVQIDKLPARGDHIELPLGGEIVVRYVHTEGDSDIPTVFGGQP